MEQILTGEEMRRYETHAIKELGIPDLVLMERAALAVADEIEKHISPCGFVLFVCGTGNNAGDGFAAARILLERGIASKILQVGDPLKMSDACRIQRQICENLHIPILENFHPETDAAQDCSLIVDALFGIGLSRKIEGTYAEVISWMNRQPAKKLAVDLPSGISADTGQILGTAVNADSTVTFAARKPGHILFPGSSCAGTVVCRPIGIPLSRHPVTGLKDVKATENAFTCTSDDLPGLLPPRKAHGNKGTCGKVLLIAGSEGMSGAACLAARAAYRSGCGLVRVFTPECNRIPVQISIPEAIVTTYNETLQAEEKLKDALSWADVCGIGPGLGTSQTARWLLQYVLKNYSGPLVLDADALNLLAADPELFSLVCQRKDPAILTPHLGEMARLTGKSVRAISEDLIDSCRSFASQHHLICVQKDARTVVSDGSHVFLNTTGNNGMATGGSGDVLTGILLGLLAQRPTSFESAVAAVTLHGLAGAAAASSRSSYSMIAGDIAEQVGTVLLDAENQTNLFLLS